MPAETTVAAGWSRAAGPRPPRAVRRPAARLAQRGDRHHPAEPETPGGGDRVGDPGHVVGRGAPAAAAPGGSRLTWTRQLDPWSRSCTAVQRAHQLDPVDDVESVDRVKLVGRSTGRRATGRAGRVPGPGQPRPGGRGRRGGAAVGDVGRIAEEIAGSRASAGRGDGGRAPGRAGVAGLRAARLGRGPARRDHPAATVVSAGMSGDLEEAIRCGATHVRVGSAVLGPRPRIQ